MHILCHTHQVHVPDNLAWLHNILIAANSGQDQRQSVLDFKGCDYKGITHQSSLIVDLFLLLTFILGKLLFWYKTRKYLKSNMMTPYIYKTPIFINPWIVYKTTRGGQDTETLFEILALCEANPPVIGGSIRNDQLYGPLIISLLWAWIVSSANSWVTLDTALRLYIRLLAHHSCFNGTLPIAVNQPWRICVQTKIIKTQQNTTMHEPFA